MGGGEGAVVVAVRAHALTRPVRARAPPFPPTPRRIRGLNMEVCTTLGMLTPEQAAELRTAGLTAYNHNLDTSPGESAWGGVRGVGGAWGGQANCEQPRCSSCWLRCRVAHAAPPPACSAEYYNKVTSSRKYEDRLATLEAVRQAGISVCAGGIIGLGEAELDRVGLLHQVSVCVCWGGWGQGVARVPGARSAAQEADLARAPHPLCFAPPCSWPRWPPTPSLCPSTRWWR